MAETENKVYRDSNLETLWVLLAVIGMFFVVAMAGLYIFSSKSYDEVEIMATNLSGDRKEVPQFDFDPIDYTRMEGAPPPPIEISPKKDIEEGTSPQKENSSLVESPLTALPLFSESSSRPQTPTDMAVKSYIEGEKQNPLQVAQASLPSPQPSAETKDISPPPPKEKKVIPSQPSPPSSTGAAAPSSRWRPTTPKVVKKAPVYWIQVGSYTSLTKAEMVSQFMDTQGLTSTVQTASLNGYSLFRVRIGAFKTRQEAEKFIQGIRTLKGFEESYIVESTAIRQS